MSVTPSNIQSMAAIIAAMNAASGDTPVGSNPLKTASRKSDAMMGSILEGFRAATEGAVESASGNKTLELAYETERDDTGVRIGSWRIDVREEHGKFYDVRHADTGDVILNDLRLYEAALAIVNGLNKGQSLNSSRSRQILEHENTYAKALVDAASYKQTMRLTEGTTRQGIAEARYSDARARAIAAKKAIQSFTDN